MSGPVLELDRITKRFGALTANADVSLSLGKAESTFPRHSGSTNELLPPVRYSLSWWQRN